ncbi:helix-turn-helix domain-containing protein [Bacilliculturomica massiliensis]|uniref:helix-turn-helix domain-containing protein n=1 Tax=Bacilliculturomica massiliensis TaxID=1917867 RepID=UPI0010308694|nr:helix-turn-helix transcriptional regulator [Bacilliculturomica massiliensis]
MFNSGKIGYLLKELMVENCFSINELATKSDVSANTIKSILYHPNEYCPTIETLNKLCNGFGMTLSDFFLKIETGNKNAAPELDERVKRILGRIERQDLNKLIDVFENLMKKQQG